MYTVDEHDQVIRMEDIPPPETGAPAPLVLSDEYGLVLSYLPAQDPQSSFGVAPNWVFIRFRIPLMHFLGLPNDEALQGHPLWGRGLDYYGVFRIDNSSLIRRLSLMNRVHPQNNWSLYEKFKHFIFTFHDSTFECVAESFELQPVRCQEAERHSRMHQVLISNRGPDPISTPDRGRIPIAKKLRWWLAALNPYQ